MSNILMCGTDPVGQVSDMTASNISYNNTSSGLTADNVQEAIDELNENKVSKSGDTMTGNLDIKPNNTLGVISLGKGSNSQEYGVVQMYDDASHWLNILPSSQTDNRMILFPDKTGTVALTSDIPSVIPKQYLNNIISTDLNNAYADDFIKIGYLQDAGLPLYGNWGMVICVAGSSGTTKVCNQVIIAQNGIATRHYEGSSWSDWKKTSFS